MKTLKFELVIELVNFDEAQEAGEWLTQPAKRGRRRNEVPRI